MKNIKRRGFTLIELAVLFGLGALFSALMLPAVQQARESARRTQCKDNLHNLGLGMFNYSDVYGGRFPCGWYQPSFAADEPDAFSWGMSVLPFVDQVPLFNQIDFDVRPSQQRPEFLAIFQDQGLEYMPLLRCPSDASPVAGFARGEWAASNYSGNFGHLPPPRWEPGTLTSLWPGMAATPERSDGVLSCDWGARFADIIDGMSYTIMAGERSAAGTPGLWAVVRGNAFENDAVTDASRFSPLNGGAGTFSSAHEGGVHFVMCDGAVAFISDEVNLPPDVRAGSLGLNGQPHGQCTMEKLACRNDGMPIDSF